MVHLSQEKTWTRCIVFDRECPAHGLIPDSSLPSLFTFHEFVQLTIDGAGFGTDVPSHGIVWH